MLFIVKSLVCCLVPSCLPLLGWWFQRILIGVRLGNLLTDFAGLVAYAGLGGQQLVAEACATAKKNKKLDPLGEMCRKESLTCTG